MNEVQETLLLANRLLDKPNVDPDDDLRKLSRQLVRASERGDALQVKVDEAVRSIDKLADLMADSDELKVKQTNVVARLNDILRNLA